MKPVLASPHKIGTKRSFLFTSLKYFREFIQSVLAVSEFFKLLHFSHDFLNKAILLLKDFKRLLSFLTNFAGKKAGYTINQNVKFFGVRKYRYEDESEKKKTNFVIIMFYKRKHYNLSACAHIIFLLLCLSLQGWMPERRFLFIRQRKRRFRLLMQSAMEWRKM